MVSLPVSLSPAMARRAERYGRWLPLLAKMLFVGLIARVAALLVWLLIPIPESAQWQPAPAASVAGPGHSGPDLALIASASLFGPYHAPTVDAPLAEAPETGLNLTLRGILAATEERGSRALIGSPNGDEMPYAVGAEIIRGVTLKAIFPDRVILSRGGRLETLRLDKDAADRASVSSGPAESFEAVGNGDEDATESLAEVREQILQDPTRAAHFIRVQPQNVGGQLRGYRIYPGRNRSPFSEAGLRPGDLVTAVNGIQLDDPTRAMQLLSDMSNSTSFTLEVQRGGQPQTITINLD